MKKVMAALLLCLLLPLLAGCDGGQEIETCLFVIGMAVDPAPNGNLTVTIKALSGSQDAQPQTAEGGTGGTGNGEENEIAQAQTEQVEPGYVVLSATAPSCLRALYLLSATTPRTVNLSQLQEVVISRTLAETDATLSVLKEIHSMYRANGSAVVVVTPDDAGDFIRRQHTLLGVRLSQYLKVLFKHYEENDTIPPDAQLSAVIAAMESGTSDAAAGYAASDDFDSTLVLEDAADIDRLPGHLPRTSPVQNEYLGAAIFSGPRMTGVLTGSETALLCLMMGQANTRTTVIDGAQYKTNVKTTVRRKIEQEGALSVHIRLNLTRIAGEHARSAGDIAAEIERNCVSLIKKLQASGCDALGFGRYAIRACLTIDEWENGDWQTLYANAPVWVTADVRVQ